MHVELDAFLSVSTLMLLIKSKSPEKLEAKEINPNENTIPNQAIIKYFDPHTDIIVAAPCSYTYKINTVQGRIPDTITEVMCENSGTKCNNSPFFSCRQEKTKMEVAYRRTVDNNLEVNLRNITVNIGCSCVAEKLNIFNRITAGPKEKR